MTRLSERIGFRRREHSRAVRFAVELESLGETNRDRLPGNVSPGILFQLRDVDTWIDAGARFEPSCERGFVLVNLRLDLLQPITESEE